MKFLLQNYPDTSAKLGLASEEAKGFWSPALGGGFHNTLRDPEPTILPGTLPKQGGGAVQGVMTRDLWVRAVRSLASSYSSRALHWTP